MTANSFNDGYVDILGPDETHQGPGYVPTAKSGGGRELPAYLARPYALVRAIPDGGTYLGVVLIVVGFVLLAICWGKVAGLTNIAYQMPFIASAGITGLGLIVVGIAIVSAASREKDAALRRAQMAELASTLRQLRVLFDKPANQELVAASVAASDVEMTTELRAILDEPFADADAVEIRRPVKVTGRTPRSPRSATARPAAKAVSRPTKTVKQASR